MFFLLKLQNAQTEMRAANIQGYLYPPFVGGETVNWLQNNWETAENDVIVVGFPRSGTTWVLNIILEIIQHADPLQINFLGIFFLKLFIFFLYFFFFVLYILIL